MKRGNRVRASTVLTAAVLSSSLLGTAAGPAVAAPPSAAPVEITAFELSPFCVEPGGALGFRLGVRNTTPRFQRTWFQVEVTYNLLFGFTTPPIGPVPLPPRFRFTIDEEIDFPRSAPPGVYRVTVAIGPSAADPQGWDVATDSVNVLPLCLPASSSVR